MRHLINVTLLLVQGMACTVSQIQIYNILKACGESDWVDLQDHLKHSVQGKFISKPKIHLHSLQPDLFN